MKKLKWVKSLVGPLLVIAVVAGLWAYRDSLFETTASEDNASSEAASGSGELEILELSVQARKNLKLRSKAARPTDYWRTITIPGMVQDRPGISDRGVTSPAVGSVAEIHVFPGDTVRPGERLVTIALFSEYLQATQTQLFKATREIALLRKEINRLSDLASSGGIAGSKLIQMDNDIERQETLTQAAKQELLNRGLSPSQVKQVVQGNFVSTIEVSAPPPRGLSTAERIDELSPVSQASFVVESGNDQLIAYEVQSLAVELGQTVQAGQLIADLANHRHLYVVGHAFKREAGLLEKAAQEAREIEVEFSDDNAEVWSPLDQSFQIRHLSNSIDVESRTFDFFIPLENQSRSYEKNSETFLVWRFRPGQRARIHVPVERLEDVFVLPSEAIAREGPDAFVYRQNGDLFNQIAVNILYEDRRSVVIANDGSITPGTFIAQNAGASLRRVLKSQSASGRQPGLHVHADGTVHAAH
ncbi:efflux RND transporter periplasmic adaptor subunit [Stieleria sp. ICT_E10.1]|uniref:efflux RND transporter periplasmic adaptor subunit n=1 Tax=Stieleria sedimenti TaxID=2976331 RepID=UPI00217F5F0A|nr:efflux RND transporter periplasmic adaptor subunit [Stieleria sedimenti]MCS7465140.1 efflux RND transporter periplasmic adaptor subunit [Stieleria sedimenti]